MSECESACHVWELSTWRKEWCSGHWSNSLTAAETTLNDSLGCDLWATDWPELTLVEKLIPHGSHLWAFPIVIKGEAWAAEIAPSLSGKCTYPSVSLSSVLNIHVNEQTKPGLGGRDMGPLHGKAETGRSWLTGLISKSQANQWESLSLKEKKQKLKK